MQQRLTDGILDSYPQAVFHHNAPLPPSPATDLGQQPSVARPGLLSEPPCMAFCRANRTSLAAVRPPCWLPPQNPVHGHHIEAQDSLPQPME
ncbi:hypothetical protein O181_121646 [Austropuccinia psidii MF-1]|uniref:Uncharacterized protein n=1 Tax=Austropuccinia psidii MF-1 TaxID=1389203 RepID=A0A9Q3Q1M9_9BASI|nr:hypothetical protein [Austropuccinia psidii MF-1]